MTPITYLEASDSQFPALLLLQKMGWQYISKEDAEKQRFGILSNVVLEDILATQLAKFNSFEYKGEKFEFSRTNIQAAINALKNVTDEGLVQTNEKIYDLLTLGKSFNETVQGDRKAYTLKYIDWECLENNVFHIAEEFEVSGPKENRRPDLVLFVNGIPFVVIENKRRDKNESLEEAISQHLRNQRKAEGVPRLFHYAQFLLAVHPNEVKYGCTGTPAKFWAVWKEDVDKKVTKLIHKQIGDLEGENRLSTVQDKNLYSLCEPSRLMDLVYKFIVFDGAIKKVCRYQQYFAVQDTLARVSKFDAEEKRKGGVIWHTTGSGKSLTMVMLSKALALDKSIKSPRIVVVTDRVNLDKQIYKTFLNCGKNVQKAKSGNDLVDLLKDKGNEIITTILDKFETAANKAGFIDESSDIFVLVDESHRGHYKTAHSYMKKILPNACYIGFTGTPLMKREKSTSKKFGGFIHKYTIDQAVKDGAVVPLLYEGRAAKLSVNKKQIDKGFERLTAPLEEEAAKDLKKKFSRISQIYESEQVIGEIAHDISVHFTTNWQGTGFKAQLAAPKIDTAIKYQRYFEKQTDPSLKINTRVVFTPKDSREGNEDVWEGASDEAKKYWENIKEQWKDQDTYETWVIDNFKDEGNTVELIIVVSKLLTGFDAPRNTILYLAKPLKDHNLLQAISRVNRLFEGKEYGYIVDYVGILGKLDEALTAYSALEDFDEEDLMGAVVDIREEIRKIPGAHADVLDIFRGIYNKQDIEALERHLLPKDLRDEFYDKLSVFARLLQTAFSSDELYKELTESQINFYKSELKRFQSLRQSVQLRYAEKVSYKEYEPRVRKLLDTYIQADEVEVLTNEVNIFDSQMVQEALQQYGEKPASKADFIAHRLKKVITENMDKDEAFYKKFSELIEQTIEDFHKGRISEAEYLEKMIKARDDMDEGHIEGIPDNIKNEPKARAFYGAVKEVFEKTFGLGAMNGQEQGLAQAGIDIANIVGGLVIRDWKRNLDVQREMENQIEDYLMAHRKDLGVELSFDDIDEILAKCLKVAKNNY